jgi:hypothetical protein
MRTRGGKRARSWEAEAKSLAPVFIVGEARSGTSILYRSIQNHPSFMPAEGVHLAESHAMDGLLRVLHTSDAAAKDLSAFLMGGDALSSFVEDIEPLAPRRKVVRRLAGRHIVHPVVWKVAGEHHVVRRYFLEASRRRGAPRLVEKTPNHIQWVPHLASVFPNARFVYIVRHPVDVLSSYNRRFEAAPRTASWAGVTPDTFCARWKTNTSLAITLAKREPRFLVIRYEDLTSRAAETIQVVLDHVGEPFDDVCLLPGSTPPPSWTQDPHLWSPIMEKTKDWSEFLDRGTAMHVEHQLRETMALIGYDMRTGGAGLEPATV